VTTPPSNRGASAAFSERHAPTQAAAGLPKRLETLSFALLLAALVTSPLGSNVSVPGHPSVFAFRILFVLFVLAEIARLAVSSASRPRITLREPLTLWSGLAAWAALSIAWSASKGEAVRYVVFLAQSTVLMYAIASHGRDRRKLLMMLGAYGVSFVVVVGGALFERADTYRFPVSMFRDPQLDAQFRFLFTSVFHNPNDLATFISFWFPLLLVAYLEGTRIWARVVALGLCGLSAFLVVIDLSRANTVSMALATVVVLVVTLRRRPAAWAIALGLVIVGFLMLPARPKYLALQAVHFLTSDVESGSAARDTRARLARESLELLSRSHGLGVGAGNAETMIRELRADRQQSQEDKILRMHNWWMEVLVNLGVAGFALYLVFYGWLLVGLAKTRRLFLPGDWPLAAFSLSVLASLVGFVIGCLSSSSLLTFNPLWVQFGFAAALVRLQSSAAVAAEPEAPRPSEPSSTGRR